MSILLQQTLPRPYALHLDYPSSSFARLRGSGVLLFSALDTDEEACIARRLRTLGVPAAIVPMPLAPERLRLELGRRPRLILEDAAIPLSRVGAVWSLCGMDRPLPPGADPVAHGFDLGEWRATLGLLAGELRARWTNHPSVAALSRLAVLKLASELGFRVPRSLVTNDPASAMRFLASLRGACVVKRVGHAFPTQPDGTVLLTFTRRLEPCDVTEALRACPVLLQEEIPKVCEYRCYVLAGELLVFRIQAPLSPDWRALDASELSFETVDLDSLTGQRVCALVDLLGLSYAAVDFIEDPKGGLYFLEVNPNGVHRFCRDLVHPTIDRRIAAHLAGQCHL